MAPDVTLEVNQTSDLWDPVDFGAVAKAIITDACRALEIEEIELSVLLCDDAEIARLNEEFRGKAKPTNVLSWPSFPFKRVWEPQFPFAKEAVLDPEVGDIALAFETIAQEAKQANLSFDHHLAHLTLHGVLHCLGFDHETEESAAYMEDLERKILARAGLHDPYYSSEDV